VASRHWEALLAIRSTAQAWQYVQRHWHALWQDCFKFMAICASLSLPCECLSCSMSGVLWCDAERDPAVDMPLVARLDAGEAAGCRPRGCHLLLASLGGRV